MIRMENRFGTIEITHHCLAMLIGNAVSSCFGVAGMVSSNARQGLRKMLGKKQEFIDQGVQVHKENGELAVDLHIVVTYGVNITAIVQSIGNKVRYTVQEATGLQVERVNVHVDGMKSE